MKKMLFFGAMLFALSFAAFAGEHIQNDLMTVEKKSPVSARYTEDRITMQLVTGPFFSGTGFGPSIPEYNYVLTNLRAGWMLNTPEGDSPLRGCWEAIGELSGAGVMRTFGNFMFGPTVLIRYNFVQPDWVVVPYLQGGGGIVYNDGYEDANQRALGQAFEFTPQASAGARFLVAKDWSIDAEVMFHHISNACIANRNLGVNAVGGMIGFTYFFDKLWTD